eukprot:4876914-Pleurochrysis_carterae.AAC.1
MTGWAAAVAPHLAQPRRRVRHPTGDSEKLASRPRVPPRSTRAKQRSVLLSRRPTRTTTRRPGWSATGWQRT